MDIKGDNMETIFYLNLFVVRRPSTNVFIDEGQPEREITRSNEENLQFLDLRLESRRLKSDSS